MTPKRLKVATMQSFTKMHRSLGVVVFKSKSSKVSCLRANLTPSKKFFHVLSAQLLLSAHEGV